MNERNQVERQAAESLTREKIRTPMTLREGRSSSLRTLTAEEIQGVRGGYSDPGPNCNRWGYGC
ncbi:hypothetical protein GWC77_05650 [Paraburkholderia sp. NMBU_R16]|uniref:hypothetical protein n=1 Tax=Paraburkholderia sp. NMBU_R16 TaxID=2698676 RepID=UPI001566A20D|nr:hypothetical protein [Paraburkholderia sp. NMBU_R16]NRO95420.1 hypothetical protein [Paraburkholderia sp. NMBU_R16]